MHDAVLEVQHAREVDPLSVIVNSDLCTMLIFARRYEEALAQCKSNADLNPEAIGPYWWLGVLYAAKGMESEAIHAFLRAMPAARDTPI
jgi:tetratricopeptide (TPR) repeat protein